MKPVTEMSIDEARAEAVRRADRRRRGLPMAPTEREAQDELAAGEKEKDDRLEKEIQRDVVKLYVKAGCKVRNSSQPRKAKYLTPGGADLQVFSPLLPLPIPIRVMWYHETKRPKGVYSVEQLEFAADCREAGIRVIGGGVQEAREQLRRLNLIE